jgi:hypothetical protein
MDLTIMSLIVYQESKVFVMNRIFGILGRFVALAVLVTAWCVYAGAMLSAWSKWDARLYDCDRYAHKGCGYLRQTGWWTYHPYSGGDQMNAYISVFFALILATVGLGITVFLLWLAAKSVMWVFTGEFDLPDLGAPSSNSLATVFMATAIGGLIGSSMFSN